MKKLKTVRFNIGVAFGGQATSYLPNSRLAEHIELYTDDLYVIINRRDNTPIHIPICHVLQMEIAEDNGHKTSSLKKVRRTKK